MVIHTFDTRPAFGYNAGVSSAEHEHSCGEGTSARGGHDLTVGSIPRLLVVFALPMLAGSALQTAYSLVNGYWVGRYLGTDSLAAVTVSMPIVFVLYAAAAGLTLATNILIAQAAGAHDWVRVRRVVNTSILLIGGLGVLFLAIGQLFAAQLLHLINTPETVFPIAVTYLRLFLWTMPFSFGIFILGSMLRGIGDSRTPVYFQAASVLLTAILDPLLMLGWLGFPHLGLNGTAWATIFAQVLAVAALLIYLPRYCPLVTPDWRRPQVDREIGGLLAVIGLPSMVQQSVVSASLLVVVGLVSTFGEKVDAAFGAALRIDNVAFLPALTIGMAVSTLAGQNIGAGKLSRVRQTFWWGMLLSTGISLLITLLVRYHPQLILGAFLRDTDVIAFGAEYLTIVSITYVLYAIMFVSNGVINGAGHTMATTLISVIALMGIRLPLSYYLARIWGSQLGIWYAMTISVGCGMILSLLYYASGLWKHPFGKPNSAGTVDETP